MKSNLEPEHGEILSQEDWNKLSEKIGPSHCIAQQPFGNLLTKENNEEGSLKAWLKKMRFEKIYEENKEVIDKSIICSISPATDVPPHYRTDVGRATFFIKK